MKQIFMGTNQCTSVSAQPAFEPAECCALHLQVKLVRTGIELPNIGFWMSNTLIQGRQASICSFHAFEREQIILQIILHK